LAALVPCLACDRFVRATDEACPFCGTTRVVEVPKLRVPNAGRAALFAVAMATSACAGDDDGGGDVDAGPVGTMDAGRDAGELVAPPYGIPVDAGDEDEDAGTSSDAGAVDAGPDAGEIIAPPYGIPVEDAGPDGGPDAGELVAPLYGSPPPPDPDE